jgi:hypothetical protein
MTLKMAKHEFKANKEYVDTLDTTIQNLYYESGVSLLQNKPALIMAIKEFLHAWRYSRRKFDIVMCWRGLKLIKHILSSTQHSRKTSQ